MNKKHFIPAICYLMFAASYLMISCQDSAWDDHYGLHEGSSQTLMEILDNNNQFSEFARIVRQNGLDSLLSADQSYTVWAPTNNAMAKYVDNGQTVEHFIKNHINRYLYGVANLTDTSYVRIKMLNDKLQDYTRSGSNYSFAGVSVDDKSLLAGNGVVHTLNDIAPFYFNLYEDIKQTSYNTDSLAAYLNTMDVYTFNQDASTVIGKDAAGQLVYDSVFNYSSKFMKRFGDIYLEDSLYTMLVPLNNAWNEGFEKVSKYFRTFGECLSSSENSTTYVPTRTYAVGDSISDSLTTAHTKENMVSNLIFRRKVDFSNADGDSLTATSGNVFHHPINLIAEAKQEMLSNGTAWKLSKWNYNPEDCFLKVIEVEAEDTKGRSNAYSTVYTRSATSTSYSDSVSGTKYIEIQATSTNVRNQPMVQFTIPNTLAATYNIYCVFVPAEAYSEDVKADSTRVNFYLNYVDEKGNMKESAAIKSDIITNGHAMTKMFVAQVTLPYANFSSSVFKETDVQDTDCMRLRVQTNVASNETSKLSRTIRIDKIIFEPVVNNE